MATRVLNRPILRTTLLDALLCAAAVSVPALSHAAAFPFYYLDPMRLLIFAAILFSGRRNALIMALGLPLLAMATSGHPVFPKVVLIQAELAINVLLLEALLRRTGRFALSATVSVVASKGLYYGAKFVLVEAALLDGGLVSTPWLYQAGVLAIVALGGAMIHRIKT